MTRGSSYVMDQFPIPRSTRGNLLNSIRQPGHEYTKSNAKFAISVLPSGPVKKLQEFATSNKETQGQFTIGDEKEHNPFMRMDVRRCPFSNGKRLWC
jgi:hypothetical protein